MRHLRALIVCLVPLALACAKKTEAPSGQSAASGSAIAAGRSSSVTGIAGASHAPEAATPAVAAVVAAAVTTAITATVAAAVATPFGAGATASGVESAKPFANRWLVVLSASKEPGFSPPDLPKLLEHPEVPRILVRLRSTELRGLMPCYEVLVAESFTDPKEARAYSAKLHALGIEHYLKNAGRHVGRQPSVEAYCQREKQPQPPTRCAGLHFVEQREGRSFLRLQLDAALISRVPAAGPPRPVGTAFSTWTAPIAARTLGPYGVDQKFLLYTGSAAAAAGACTLRGFLWLTRGTPHFGYLQEAKEKKQAPAAPACGSPEIYGELDCGAAKGTLAQASSAPAPGLFALSPEVTDAALVEKVKTALRAGEGFQRALAGATQAAKDKGQPLTQTYKLRELRGAKTSLWLLEMALMTGEGMTACGGEDVRVDLVGMVERKADGSVGAVRVPARPLPQASITGALELGAEGSLALLVEELPEVRRLVSAANHEPLCELAVPFCDCGC